MQIIAIAQQENSWDITMRFLNSEALPGEPVYVEFKAMNKSSIALPYWWHYMNPDFFELDKKNCQPWTRLRGPKMHLETRKEASINYRNSSNLRQPGFSEMLIIYINNVCSIIWNGDKKIDYGNHELCYFWDEQHKACATFYYKEPTGIDAEAFSVIRKATGIDISNSSYSFFPILRDYPTSIYAAWIHYADIFKPTYKDADRIVKLIPENLYPAWNSVRDPSSTRENRGWRSIEEGKPMAAWAKEKSLFILKHHPDFVFADRLRIIAAICDIVLGKEDEGIKQIQDLIKAEEEKIKASSTERLMSIDIQWAKKFLDAWQKKKISVPPASTSK